MIVKNLYIIGLGVIGTSIAKLVKDRNKNIKIFGYDINSDINAKRKEDQVIDEIMPISDCHKVNNLYIMIATDVDNTIAILKEINKIFEKHQIQNVFISDTCSVKQKIIYCINDECLNINNNFYSVHPMFGGREVISDVNNARNALWYAIKTKKSLTFGVMEFMDIVFTEVMGYRVRYSIVTPLGHDMKMAKISHLNHILALILYKLELRLNADTIDLALQMIENHILWDKIISANKEYVAAVLNSFIKLYLKDYLEIGNFKIVFEAILNKIQKDEDTMKTPSSIKLRKSISLLPKAEPHGFVELLKLQYESRVDND